MNKELYEDRFAPITKEIGFLECDCAKAADEFARWIKRLNKRARVITTRVEGELADGLLKLLPLRTLPHRYLFVPTRSAWCGFFDNSWRGTDASGAMSVMAEQYCHCRGMRVVSVPHTHRKAKDSWKGRYGAVMLEVYAPYEIDIHNTERAIACSNDGGRWVFSEGGKPYKFENLAQYRAKKIRDRFTSDMLAEYLLHFGMRPFDADFYCPRGSSMFLVEQATRLGPEEEEYSLEDVQNWMLSRPK